MLKVKKTACISDKKLDSSKLKLTGIHLLLKLPLCCINLSKQGWTQSQVASNPIKVLVRIKADKQEDLHK